MAGVQLAPQVNGVVSKILFAAGQRVAQGDVMFELDSDAFATCAQLKLSSPKRALA